MGLSQLGHCGQTKAFDGSGENADRLTTVKNLQDTPMLINNSKARLILPDHLQAGSEAAMKTSMACCGNTSLRKDLCPRALMRKLE
jgi:hypothetical protein